MLGRRRAQALARRRPQPRSVRTRRPGRDGRACARSQLLGHLPLERWRAEPHIEEANPARRCHPLHRRAFFVHSRSASSAWERSAMARAWHLKNRPQGLPTSDNFELREIALPQLGPDMLRVRNLWLSVDPYMLCRMNDLKIYVTPFSTRQTKQARSIG